MTLHTPAGRLGRPTGTPTDTPSRRDAGSFDDGVGPLGGLTDDAAPTAGSPRATDARSGPSTAETATGMGLGAAAALGWSGVFPGVGAVVPLAAAAAAAVLGTALLARTRWGRGARALVLVGGFAVTAAAVAERRPPTPAALADVVAGLRDGWAQILDTHLPVAARGAPLTTALAVLWAAGCLSAGARLVGRPVLGLVPPLVALGAGLAFGASAAAPPETSAAVLVAATAGTIVAASARGPGHRHQGPRPPTSGGRRGGRRDRAASPGATTAATPYRVGTSGQGRLGALLSAVATAGVVVAVVALVGTAWPGASAREPYDPRQLREPPLVIDDVDNPLDLLGGALADGENPELFRATVRGSAEQVTGWQVVALDHFDPEGGWTTSSTFQRVGAELPLRVGVGTRRIEQVVTPVGLHGPFLPTMASPVDVDLVSGGRTSGDGPDTGAASGDHDDGSPAGSEAGIATDGKGTLAMPGATRLGRYRVVSAVPDVGADDVAAARPARAGSVSEVPAILAPQFDRVLREAPPNASPSAAGWLRAMQDWFRTNLRPANTDPGRAPPTGNSAYHLSQLFEDGFGTAEQFASAYALLARQQGFETRVVVGYRPGTRDDGTGELVVRSHDAHAWPEVRFEGIGWVAFDPTPRQESLPDDTATQDDDTEQAGGSPADDVTPTTATTAGDGAGAGAGGDDAGDGRGSRAGEGGSSPSWVTRALGAAAALVVVLALALGTTVVAKTVRRRRQERGSPDERVAGAWSAALDRLAEGGVRVPRHLTATEVVTAPGVPAPATEPLAHLAEVANACRFSGTPATEADATVAWQASSAVAEAIRSHHPSLRLALNPVPLLPR